MAVIPVGYAQVTLNFVGSHLPRPAAVVIGVKPATGATPTTVGEIITETMSDAQVMSGLTSGVQCLSALVKFGPNDVGPSVDHFVGLGGTSGGEPLIANSAILISKGTALGGRRGRGRMYWPGLLSASVGDDSRITNTAATAFQNHFADWLTGLAAAGAPMVLLGATEAPAGGPPLVTSLNVRNLPGTQRHRLRR